MGHLAVTDVATRGFHSEERFARGALELAGARAEPFEVWLHDWRIADADPAVFDPKIEAAGRDAGIQLHLVPEKPHVLQGDRGLSAKGPSIGNASHYYSFTRLRGRGQVVVEGESFDVEGLAWFDREWSTSALAPGVVGWDWFALHLDDGRDLMLYLLRREDGSSLEQSAGVLVSPDGSSRRLSRDELRVEITSRWTSPDTGASYPSGWRLALEDGTRLTVSPVQSDQEWTASVRYWEGAVDVRGKGPAGDLTGSGYVEMTGYGASPPPSP